MSYSIYVSVFWDICDILGYHKFSKAWFFVDYLNISKPNLTIDNKSLFQISMAN